VGEHGPGDGRRRAAQAACRCIEQVGKEPFDVLAPLAHRRQRQAHARQAIEQRRGKCPARMASSSEAPAVAMIRTSSGTGARAWAGMTVRSSRTCGRA
jgi:hypothetical protein